MAQQTMHSGCSARLSGELFASSFSNESAMMMLSLHYGPRCCVCKKEVEKDVGAASNDIIL